MFNLLFLALGMPDVHESFFYINILFLALGMSDVHDNL
jgi:hypothetical protein